MGVALLLGYSSRLGSFWYMVTGVTHLLHVLCACSLVAAPFMKETVPDHVMVWLTIFGKPPRAMDVWVRFCFLNSIPLQ